MIASDSESNSNESNNRPSEAAGQYNNRGFDKQNSEKSERPRAGAMEVYVDHNIEKAMKILKRKLIKEGLFKELKSRRYYEKPSERKKRKNKESIKKVRKDEARQKKNSLLF